ncbi:MAG: 2-hydroxyacid dehydrogenase [Candidatus Thermoplasmatota archaeon]|nr:2-hydroxyacid dehydrogenase [Candidatus Thermoplasmatota archaeon]
MRVTIMLDVGADIAEKCSAVAGIPVDVKNPDGADIQIGMRDFVPTPHLKLVQTVSAGVDHLNFRNFSDRVLFCSNAGAFSDSVAQHAFALILSSTNRICRFNDEIRSGVYRKDLVHTLYGETLGILGYGGIGQSCARIARSLGMKVLAYTRSRRNDGYVDRYADGPEEVMSGSSVVIIALPLTTATRNYIDRKLLQKFRGNIIVNIARADIVSKGDMIVFLKENPGVMFLSDVWWNEPNVELPLPENSVITPHVAGISQESMTTALMRACGNVKKYLEGKPEHVVNVKEYL